MAWMDGLWALGFAALGSVITVLIFRRTSGKERLWRLPLFLTCSLPFFYFAAANLPVVFEPILTKIIGHSIWDLYHFPKSANGTEFSETWWVARWLSPVQTVVFILVPIGMVWAFVNFASGRQPKANAIGVVVGVVLCAFALWLYVTIGQFF